MYADQLFSFSQLRTLHWFLSGFSFNLLSSNEINIPSLMSFINGVLSGLSLMYGVWTVWKYHRLTDLKSAIVYNLVFAGGGSFIIPSWNSPCNYGLYVLALHFLLFGTESHRKRDTERWNGRIDTESHLNGNEDILLWMFENKIVLKSVPTQECSHSYKLVGLAHIKNIKQFF